MLFLQLNLDEHLLSPSNLPPLKEVAALFHSTAKLKTTKSYRGDRLNPHFFRREVG